MVSLLLSASVMAASVTGYVKFEADYSDSGGQIPNGYSSYAYAYVCVYDMEGSYVDFDPASSESDDTLLGCAQTSTMGSYTVTPENFGSGMRTLYLVHWYCDEDDADYLGEPSAAEVCIRTSDGEGSGLLPANRKYVWSTPRLLYMSSTASVNLGWNVSCPAEDFYNDSSPDCASPGSGGSTDDDNSTIGFNKEFAHALRAAIEPQKTHGTNKPNTSNTDGWFGFYCSDDRCHDEINLAICGAEYDPNSDFGMSTCDGTSCSGNNGSNGYDKSCITTPFEAFRVSHEIGHNVHRRWMSLNSPLAKNLDCSDWDSVEDERCATSEGWANFFSASSWYNDNATSPTYSGHDIEDPTAFSYSCNIVHSTEGRVAQYFWDLYDNHNDTNESDSVDLTFSDIRKVWSRFTVGQGNHQNDEDVGDPLNPDGTDWAYRTGRNMQDYKSRAMFSGTAHDNVRGDNCMEWFQDN